MILVIDVGNTNIKYGIFDGDRLAASFRVASSLTRTADEYGSTLLSLLKSEHIEVGDVEGVIISSVIPSLNYTIDHMCRYYIGRIPHMTGPGTKTGLNLRTENPREVGADRIVDCVAAFRKYGGPVVVIDFGTATTFTVLTAKGEMIGGVIAPGIKGSLDSLVESAAKLPRIELEDPGSVLAKNTVTNMQAGIIYGFAGLVEYIVEKIKRELGERDVRVVATGGLGEIISKEAKCIQVVDRTLTLEGLRMLYEYNRPEDNKR